MVIVKNIVSCYLNSKLAEWNVPKPELMFTKLLTNIIFMRCFIIKVSCCLFVAKTSSAKRVIVRLSLEASIILIMLDQ